jgi:hypothetical protein
MNCSYFLENILQEFISLLWCVTLRDNTPYIFIENHIKITASYSPSVNHQITKSVLAKIRIVYNALNACK